MKLMAFLPGGGISAIVLACGVPVAAAVHECVASNPTAASYTWNFKGEANPIFQGIRADAELVRSVTTAVGSGNHSGPLGVRTGS
jgi:hypothetical protein